MKYELPVHPEEVTKKLFGVLTKRTRDVLDQRFGLVKNSRRMTLEAIGQKYGITRERVRQIEADGLNRIKKSGVFGELKNVFISMEEYFDREGKILKESTVLENLAPHPKHANHIFFLMSLHDPFLRCRESDDLHDRWAFGEEARSRAEKTLDDAVSELRKINHPVHENRLFEILSASAKNVFGAPVSTLAVTNWLDLSKLVSKNYFGEWGLVESPEIRPRGVRDLSHIVMLKYGKPLHFSEVAARIGKLVERKMHVQTVHNELIRDPRFVLVGRGLYALKDWGYTPGVVRDVVAQILKTEGPLSKEKIISAVLKERFVKPNTVFINLENTKYFKKLPDGRYYNR